MSPNETLFLEATNRVTKDDISHSSFMQFQVWDFPGQLSFLDEAFDCDAIFGNCGALVFVIDSQDDLLEALAKLHLTVTKAFKVLVPMCARATRVLTYAREQVNPDIKFEVFIHKVDGLSDDHKIGAQRCLFIYLFFVVSSAMSRNDARHPPARE
jgi:Ras-related GTP-binding protein C/D